MITVKDYGTGYKNIKTYTGYGFTPIVATSTRYICSYCHSVYFTKEEAKRCEAFHRQENSTPNGTKGYI